NNIGGRERSRSAALFIGELGSVPGVGFVIERVRVAHVELTIDVGLHAEDQFGIADVAAKIGGHCRRILKQIGEQIPVGLEQRVAGLKNVEMHRSVVSVD